MFYLERVRVQCWDDRIVYLTQNQQPIEHFFNIPERNTAFVLLGKGTSITDAAVRKLAESGVMLGFVGNGGAPLFSGSDAVLIEPQSEYRPTEYMQEWAKLWFDEAARLAAAKQFQRVRCEWVRDEWPDDVLDQRYVEEYLANIDASESTMQLMSYEAVWAKRLYKSLAQSIDMDSFTREEGKRSKATVGDLVNGFIDHGNYLAYGYASVALYALGISFAFAVLHGKTRRGGLVFDVADLFKDVIVLPAAFDAGKEGLSDQQFRDGLVDRCIEFDVIDRCIETMQSVISESVANNQ